MCAASKLPLPPMMKPNARCSRRQERKKYLEAQRAARGQTDGHAQHRERWACCCDGVAWPRCSCFPQRLSPLRSMLSNQPRTHHAACTAPQPPHPPAPAARGSSLGAGRTSRSPCWGPQTRRMPACPTCRRRRAPQSRPEGRQSVQCSGSSEMSDVGVVSPSKLARRARRAQVVRTGWTAERLTSTCQPQLQLLTMSRCRMNLEAA